ncbi:hypothetical protein RRG08_051337 [Elysia crispata]|uniref:Uncharacterized protein n=1 Tax=Elysia crispata TaxID=231223 RepID=A0AAE1B461_9GAST|nr:hypothetical protein RRG08_051337 [Elysia crispata]
MSMVKDLLVASDRLRSILDAVIVLCTRAVFAGPSGSRSSDLVLRLFKDLMPWGEISSEVSRNTERHLCVGHSKNGSLARGANSAGKDLPKQTVYLINFLRF